MKHLDLFSGYGGFTLAGMLEGFETIAFSEIEPYACRILAERFPGIPNLGDVRNITRDSVLRRTGCLPALVTGGFPCQDLSCAGARAGLAGARSGLWSECARLLCELRPRYALFENVPGLFTSGYGLDFNRILSDMAALRYDCLWQVLSASSIGPSQKRASLVALHGRRRDGRTGRVAGTTRER